MIKMYLTLSKIDLFNLLRLPLCNEKAEYAVSKHISGYMTLKCQLMYYNIYIAKQFHQFAVAFQEWVKVPTLG